MINPNTALGLIAALSASFSWTLSCYLWRSQTNFFSASQLNLIKNIIAFLFFLPIAFTVNWVSEFKPIIILLLSGVIGISLGDSFYIRSLRCIGTRRTLSIESLTPILANIFGTLFLGEPLSLKSFIGALIVTISLLIISLDMTTSSSESTITIRSINSGFYSAIISVICAVIASVLSREILTTTSLTVFQTTEIRLIGSLLPLLLFVRLDLSYIHSELSKRNLIKLLISSILGTNLGILFQQTVFKTLPLGIGWTLLSTSPIISLLFARREGENLNFRVVLLTLSVFLGVTISLL